MFINLYITSEKHRIVKFLRFIGNVDVQGCISYASQDPWLFPSTIRQNILFGEAYDSTRYDEVIRVCALEYDLSLLDDGDLTVIADNGMNLSKGQQARINLARAVYRRADIYLLDDSLTALDTSVQDFIFTECLLKFLNDKICILVSQNHHHLNTSRNVIFLDKGISLISDNDETNRNAKMNTVKTNYCEKIEQYVIKKEQEFVENELDTNIYKEVKETGKVKWNVYKKYYLLAGGSIVMPLIIIALYTFSFFSNIIANKMLSEW